MKPLFDSIAGDGARLACGEWPGRGSPIVALHGITSSLMSFCGVAEMLDGRRPLLALDLRGHGDSDRPDGPYTIEQHARDVASAMNQRSLGPTIVVGHSFGAYVAVALAATAPELVSALVLVDGGYPPLPLGANGAAFAEMAMLPSLARVRLRHVTAADHLESWLATPGLAGGRREWIERFASHDVAGVPPSLHSKVDERTVRAAYHDMVDTSAIERRLERVMAPMTIVRAQHGAARNLPPIVPDEVVIAVRRRVRRLGVATVDATHYTILLGERGARAVVGALEEVSR